MRILQLAGYFFPEKAASIYLEENRYESRENKGLPEEKIYEPVVHRCWTLISTRWYMQQDHKEDFLRRNIRSINTRNLR